jgi:DNA invertase Pin-like site-specific DNA recombinase
MVSLIRHLSSNEVYRGLVRTIAALLDALAIRASLSGMATSSRRTSPSRRAALYVRVSTADRGQTVENQLQPLQDAARRLGWSIVAIYRDEGISGARGRDKRPGLDALLKGVARREFDIVAAWSVCRLGRSLPDLIGLLGELQARDVDLFLHQQAIDSSTPSGRALFGMLGVFAEFERAMIRDRIMAGLDRAKAAGKRLGRPRTTPFQIGRIRAALDEGRGVRETARLLKVSPAKVSEVRRMSAISTAPGNVGMRQLPYVT